MRRNSLAVRLKFRSLAFLLELGVRAGGQTRVVATDG